MKKHILVSTKDNILKNMKQYILEPSKEHSLVDLMILTILKIGKVVLHKEIILRTIKRLIKKFMKEYSQLNIQKSMKVYLLHLIQVNTKVLLEHNI